MRLEIYIRLAGALQIALAIIHAFFPKRFNWKEELGRLSLLNRQMFLVHTVFIGFVLLMMGALSLFATEALLQPGSLSRLVLGGIAGFWFLRLICQWFVYDWRLWKGHPFNTFIQIVFTVFWIFLTSVYAAALVSQLR